MSLMILPAAFFALMQPAVQTPPDVITIGDDLFATNGETLFVYRSTNDNLGVCQSDYSERFLVAIDVATGEEQYWLVYRARRDQIFDEATGDERVEVTYSDREDWHDPYQIIADADAFLLERVGTPPPPAIIRQPGGIRLSYDSGQQFDIYYSPSVARARASLADLAQRMSDVPRMAPVSTRELLQNRQIDWDSCSFTALGRPLGTGPSAFQIIRLRCHDGDDMEQTSLLQVVRVNGADSAP